MIFLLFGSTPERRGSSSCQCTNCYRKKATVPSTVTGPPEVSATDQKAAQPLAGADPASSAISDEDGLAGPLSSRPLGPHQHH
jgi:hypothetical protein